MALLSPEQTTGAPPFVPWSRWYAEQAFIRPGHMLFSGPTQSGKTTLCRQLARLRQYVVVFGTKPVDPALDAYVAEGYTRISTWPAPPAAIKKSARDNDGDVRLILWPKIKKREELRKFRAIYAKALDEIFIEGRWTIVVDEGLWLSSRSGLNLGQELGDVCYGTASNQVKVYLLVQRPANVPPVAWTSVSGSMIFHSGRVDDIRELASLGTYKPRDVAAVVQGLQGHQFLDLPCRGQASWAISEVGRG